MGKKGGVLKGAAAQRRKGTPVEHPKGTRFNGARRSETEKAMYPVNPVNPVQYKTSNSAEPTNSYEESLKKTS